MHIQPSIMCCCFALTCHYDLHRALLFGGMRESQPGVDCIELQDERPYAFSVLLSYIYTGKVRLTQLKVKWPEGMS